MDDDDYLSKFADTTAPDDLYDLKESCDRIENAFSRDILCDFFEDLFDASDCMRSVLHDVKQYIPPHLFERVVILGVTRTVMKLLHKHEKAVTKLLRLAKEEGV